MGDGFKDVQSIAWDLLRKISCGSGLAGGDTELSKGVLCKEEIKVVLVTGVCHMKKKGSLQTLIPFCHSQLTL